MEHGNHLAAPSALALSLAVAAAALYVSGSQHASSRNTPIDFSALAPDGIEVRLPTGLADFEKGQPKTPVARYVQNLGDALERE